MQNKFSNISVPNIPVATDFKSQQRSLVVAFGNLVAQLNQPIDTTFDVQNNRITGLLDPAQLNDAVPLSYLQRQLSTLSGSGQTTIINQTNTITITGSGGPATSILDTTLTTATTTITSSVTPTVGGLYVVYLTQDGTGGRQIVWGTTFKTLGNQIDIRSGKLSIYTFNAKNTTNWYMISSNLGL